MTAEGFISERHVVLPVKVAPYVWHLARAPWEQYLRDCRRDGRVPDPEVLSWFRSLAELVGDDRPVMTMDRRRMISVREAASVLGVTPRRVTTMCQVGQLRAEQPFGARAWRIDEESVLERVEFRKAA